MWITTKDGRQVNTDWFDEDERKKYEQIAANKAEADALNNPDKAHLDEENKRVAELMKKRSGGITMKNGQILEKYTLSDMKSGVLKDAKDVGELYEDNYIAILYTDGTVEAYAEHDDTSKMKLTNIRGAIWDNGSTIGYAGNGVDIVNYREKYAEDYKKRKDNDDDWRMEFTCTKGK